MLRRLLVPAILIAAFAIPTAAAQATPEPGVNLQGNFFSDPAQSQAVTSLNVAWIRVFVFLDRLDSGTQAAYRQTFDQLKARGVRAEAVMVADRGSSLRSDPAAFAALAKGFVTNSGSGLQAVEVWNEEDADLWWASPDPAAYAALLNTTYSVVKAARPDVTVLVGGLTGNDSQFLGPLLQQSGVTSHLDGVGVHSDTACNLNSPYVTQKDNNGVLTFSSFLGYKALLQQLAAAGRGDAKIWFTELGWSTSGQTCDQGVFAGQKNGGVSEDQQATYLKQGFHCLNQDADHIGPSFWFSMIDTTAGDTVDGRYGLLRPDESRKPAFAAYQDFIKNGDSLGNEPCGNLAGPVVTVTELGDVVKGNKLSGVYGNQMHIKGFAMDPDTVGRITLYVDGKKIRNFTDSTMSKTTLGFCINVDSAKKLALGPHTIRLDAKSGKSGNDSTKTIMVKKVKKTKKNKVAPKC